MNKHGKFRELVGQAREMGFVLYSSHCKGAVQSWSLCLSRFKNRNLDVRYVETLVSLLKISYICGREAAFCHGLFSGENQGYVRLKSSLLLHCSGVHLGCHLPKFLTYKLCKEDYSS